MSLNLCCVTLECIYTVDGLGIWSFNRCCLFSHLWSKFNSHLIIEKKSQLQCLSCPIRVTMETLNERLLFFSKYHSMDATLRWLCLLSGLDTAAGVIYLNDGEVSYCPNFCVECMFIFTFYTMSAVIVLHFSRTTCDVPVFRMTLTNLVIITCWIEFHLLFSNSDSKWEVMHREFPQHYLFMNTQPKSTAISWGGGVVFFIQSL